MRHWTKEEHTRILNENLKDKAAAAVYTAGDRCGEITPQLVRYWRSIFIENNGKMAAADRELKAKRKPKTPKQSRLELPANPGDKVYNSILVIPDQHAPYQHPDALEFLKAAAKMFQPEIVVNLGDELDFHALSFHDSDPNLDSAGVELERGKRFLAKLAKEFPHMLVCDSNHGSMVFRRAKAHGIPVQAIKSYRDVIFDGKDVDWHWADSWSLNTPLGKVQFKHQSSGIVGDAAHNQTNLVVGHSHGNFSIEYAASSACLYYGMYSGCLIDKDAMAFAYGKHSLKKPIIGCSVILQGRPVLVPMVLNEKGRWIGSL